MIARSTTSRWPITAAWLIFAVSIACFLFLKLQVGFDLSAFFPANTSPRSEVLLQQLSSGPGSRMMVIGINGSGLEQRIETGRLLSDRLDTHPSFSAVFNGQADMDHVELPEPLASGYPLMADIDYSPRGLRDALQQRLADLSFGGGRMFRTLVARDPYLVTPDLAGRLGPGDDNDEPWVADEGSAVIAAQTHAAGTDLEAQAAAVVAIQNIFSEVKTTPDLTLDITGVGAFGVKLQRIIQRESQLLGILAGSAIILVLLVVYRSLKLALLAAIPLALGFMAGVAAVVLVFGTVHGITLAFGFTLLGVTVDYPLHLFSHSRQDGGNSAIRSIWPTLRLGAASTATAYLAMVFSGSQGLSQLGVFTAVGVLVALLVTRTLLPKFLSPSDQPAEVSDGNARPARNYVYALAGLAFAIVSVVTLSGERLWNDNMDTLSPVPAHLLIKDQQLRSATVSADMRYQATVESNDLESLLTTGEMVDEVLTAARDRGLLEGWSSITTLLPSFKLQQQRLAAIPESERFSEALEEAISNTAFTKSAFRPFEDTIASARMRFPITPQSFDETPLESWRDAHLLNLSGKWVALYTLQNPDAPELEKLMNNLGDSVRWIDLKDASGQLMRDFRNDATLAVGLAAVIIVILLLIQRIGINRLAWIALSVSAAIAVSIAVVTLVHGYLTLVHLVALLLVLGLGLDYALFFSRRETSSSRSATLQSILACCASTTLAFGILAMSTIPLLKFIGLTVASGSIASLLFTWLGSRRRAKIS